MLPKNNEFSVLGGLLRDHIIGYLDNDKMIISPHLLDQKEFDDGTIENGLKTEDINRQSDDITKFSAYGKQFILQDNFLFVDK